jgi:hypothetical protein
LHPAQRHTCPDTCSFNRKAMNPLGKP